MGVGRRYSGRVARCQTHSLNVQGVSPEPHLIPSRQIGSLLIVTGNICDILWPLGERSHKTQSRSYYLPRAALIRCITGLEKEFILLDDS